MISAATADDCKILSHVYIICILWTSANIDFSLCWWVTVEIYKLPLPLLHTHSVHPFWIRSAPSMCGNKSAGSWTSQTSSGTCPASILPLVWRRKCSFYRPHTPGGLKYVVTVRYYVLLSAFTYCRPPLKTQFQIYLMFWFCLHFVHRSKIHWNTW